VESEAVEQPEQRSTDSRDPVAVAGVPCYRLPKLGKELQSLSLSVSGVAFGSYLLAALA
jgi:hypothetical protein